MIRIMQGHVLDVLARLPDESVHTVITSPPYWKVRSFGLRPQIWGGNKTCQHYFKLDKVSPETYTLAYRPDIKTVEQQAICEKCGAWWGSLGSEPTPQSWVNNICIIFKEVWRVLRKDGSLWLNLGDRRAVQDTGSGLKPKDLIGQPWMTAFALRHEGWYLRSAIILAKKAPIPEADVDRPITSYDHLFLLTKSPKYFYDGYSIGDRDINYNVKDVWWMDHEYSPSLKHYGVFPKELPRRCILLGTSPKVCPECKAPYIRVRETTKVQNHNSHVRLPKTRTIPTKEWIPSCKCNAGASIPATVLDCFGGTGTTGLMAELLGRDSIMIELSEDWVKTMKTRLSRDGGLLVNVQEET